MPNWSSNRVTITGPEVDIAALVEQLSRPYTRPHEEWLDRAGDGTYVRREAPRITTHTYEGAFLLWNIIAPDPSTMDQYIQQPRRRPTGAVVENADGTISVQLDPENFAVSWFESNSWYDWNIRVWGTKWEVSDARIDKRSNGEVVYSFDTAWSVPWGALEVLSEQYPFLTFHVIADNEVGETQWADVVAGRVQNFDSRDWASDPSIEGRE